MKNVKGDRDKEKKKRTSAKRKEEEMSYDGADVGAGDVGADIASESRLVHKPRRP